MNESKIHLTGDAGEACLTFTYDEWPFLGEVSLEGDLEIVATLEAQLSLPQAILGPLSYPAPMSKGYFHAYAAARATANELGLEFEQEDIPTYPSEEETDALWEDVLYVGKDMYSEAMNNDTDRELFSEIMEQQQYSRAANPAANPGRGVSREYGERRGPGGYKY